MGFAAGFTGGVALTLSVAYLAVRTHQLNRDTQGDLLRSYAQELRSRDPTLRPAPSVAIPGIAPPPTSTLPPPPDLSLSRAELERVRRGHFVDTLKDRWNSEIEGAVRWVSGVQWDRVRADVEGAAGAVMGATSASAAPAIHGAEEGAQAAVATSRGVITRVAEKAGGAVARVKEAVGTRMADAKTLAGTGGAGGVTEPGFSEVEEVLNQRYRPASTEERSVEEVLSERYLPADQRPARLRGI